MGLHVPGGAVHAAFDAHILAKYQQARVEAHLGLQRPAHRVDQVDARLRLVGGGAARRQVRSSGRSPPCFGGCPSKNRCRGVARAGSGSGDASASAWAVCQLGLHFRFQPLPLLGRCNRQSLQALDGSRLDSAGAFGRAL